MRILIFKRWLLVVFIIVVLSIVTFIGVFVYPGAYPALRFLADRDRIPPHSFSARVLSYVFSPVGFILEKDPFAKISSRDIRHTVHSIIYRPEE